MCELFSNIMLQNEVESEAAQFITHFHMSSKSQLREY